MATKPTNITLFPLFLLFASILLMSLFIPGNGFEAASQPHQEGNTNLPKSRKELQLEGFSKAEFWTWREKNARRLMIGSTAPTCSYNECRGCRFKCQAEQVPVDANDPINSAYHYRCVCHR